MNDTMDRNMCKACADAFFETACMIDDDPRYFEFKNEMLTPYVVNLMFACELYFKYMLIPYIDFSLRENKKHKINRLFQMLQTNNPELTNRLTILYKESFDSLTPFRELIDVLDMNDNAFEEYRYIYEKNEEKKIHTSDIAALARSLKRLANEETQYLL